MLRRTLLSAGIAAAVLATTPVLAEVKFTTYKPGVVKKALASGKTVLLDYYAPWCGTCRVQSKKIKEITAANSAYGKSITFVRVDWDTYKSKTITTGYKIPRRSTLLLLRGNKELGRVVASTSISKIQGLLNKGL